MEGGVAMTTNDMWTYSAEAPTGPMDVQGFKVEAIDGDIGKVDEATYDIGSASIVVDTGPWIFGRKVVIPAGLLDQIDLEHQRIQVRLTKDQIKQSPEYDETMGGYRSEEYRDRLGSYYDRAM
jgi:hypothetical protein